MRVNENEKKILPINQLIDVYPKSSQYVSAFAIPHKNTVDCYNRLIYI